MTSPVELIAQTLPHGLPHPGDDQTPPRVIPLPGFRTTGMGDEQAQEFIGKSATLVAEGIVALLETQYEIIPKAELQQLQAAAAVPPEGTRVIKLKTSPTGPVVLELTLGASDEIVIPAPALQALCA